MSNSETRPSSGIPEAPHPALYHRLHWLWPVFGRPGPRRVLRWLAWGLFIAWLFFAGLVLALRYAILPGIANYLPEIEAAASKAVGLPVSIGRVEARWQGLNPDLVFDDVHVSDRQGLPVFSLSRVDGVLSWESIWRGRLMLAVLAFERPLLHVRREPDGKITVAGMSTEGERDPAFAEWVLQQKRIRIRDAMIVWDDRLRKAPPLVLEDLQFGLDNSGRRHRFGLSAAPPNELAARIDVRGEIMGDIGEVLEHLAGKVFVELDYADLAGWRAWVDYPAHLPEGRGALRVWGDLEEGSGKVTADVALEELRIRLGKHLPELDLVNMRGRIEGRYKADEWMLSGHKVELLTQQGLRVVPTDFQLEWHRDPKNSAVSGSASIGFVDLAVLSSLASHLPLDSRTRELLQAHQPEGRISELRASWGLEDEILKKYALRANFADMGILARGYMPGASGLTGALDFNEKGGDLQLDAKVSRLSLPAIFPEPDTDLESLKARASWKVSPEAVDIKLDKLEFEGLEAAGSARGAYRYTGNGPGEIDLTANVDRADARAVWRYMPHVVNAETRQWIRRGIVGGRGHDGRLTLKGNLGNFPFRDGKSGKFSVTARATDAKVDYAQGWPVIQNIQANLTFGVGMKIEAQRGTLLGAKLSEVTVRIPDFESFDEMLLVKGKAQGATSEFLRFLDESPVGGYIDHFTDGMKAKGDGGLNLELDIPLRRLADTRVRGEYRFQNNELEPVSSLPPLTQVNGRLQLTEKSVTAQEIAGQVFGGPLKVQVRSSGDRVGILATGTANVVPVSRHFGIPLTEHLTGSANWKADIGIRQRNADFVIESDLVGVSSPLPVPLLKPAQTALPLRIERTAPDAQREHYRIALGQLAQGLVVRRGGNWERGAIAVGEPEGRLPEKGLAIRVVAPRIDADAWRGVLDNSVAAASGNGGLALNVLSVRAQELHLFDRDFSQVEATMRPREGGWQFGVNTREAVGDLFWRTAGEGWVEGNFKRLVVRQTVDIGEGGSQVLNTLPGMSLSVDDFYIGEMALGKLDVKARNERGAWRLDTLNLRNPDGSLKGRATWANVGRHHTGMEFELDAHDVGKLLERLGHADSVRRGSARLVGEMQWDGPLTSLHYPSLTGQLTVNAEKGQFNKLEPGVGKLLGLISLQSLPRRLTLDFRDIFSDGLAFDSLEGRLQVRKGIMSTTDPLRIVGPAALIEMQGTTDLKAETQDLQVVVRPEIGGIAAVGAAALVNPVAGAAALLANTVLQKPLNRLFSYRYHVTGSWSDPKIDQEKNVSEPVKPKESEETKP